MPLALSICALYFSLLQLVNGAQFLSTTCILLFPLPASNAATAIVNSRAHMDHYNHINLTLTF